MPARDCTTNKRSEIDVTIVKPNEIPTAELVNLNLKEEDVERWSSQDFKKAEKHLRSELKLFCSQQKFFFNRNNSDEDAVVGLSLIHI